MNKDECVAYLQKNGYTASIVNGVIMIDVQDIADFKTINKLMKSIQYNSSWGTKQLKITDNF